MAEPYRDRPWGLPDPALTVGSSWAGDACPRRAYFGQIEGLRSQRRGAVRWGDAWHAVLEDVHRWWMTQAGAPYLVGYLTTCAWCNGVTHGPSLPRCPHCSGSGLGPVARLDLEWRTTGWPEDAFLGELLRRAAEGWLLTWGAVPPAGWRVVGVEASLAYPIRSPGSRSGEPYAPEVPVVRSPDGRARLARTGEAISGRLPAGWACTSERVEAWCSIRMDAIWAGPAGQLVANEWKSSGDPAKYLRGLPVDPQVTVYETALSAAVQNGTIWLPGPGRVAWPADLPPPRPAGWWYDVASSGAQRDPTLLKSRPTKANPSPAPQFSTAWQKLGSVPSWRLRAALAQHGIAPTDAAGTAPDGRPMTWSDRVADAVARVDSRLYLRESGMSPASLAHDVALEQYATARRRAAWYRAAASAEPGSDGLRIAFPRVPVCRIGGGHCEFSGPCLADGPHARSAFGVRGGVVPDAEVDEDPVPEIDE